MDIHELQQAILKLSPEEFKLLRDWFWELDNNIWVIHHGKLGVAKKNHNAR